MVNYLASLKTTIIDEVALRCGDESFKDFPKSVYLTALHRAVNALIKNQDIIERIYSKTVKYDKERGLFLIRELQLYGVKEIYGLFVNGEEYTKRSNDRIDTPKTYAVTEFEDDIVLRYTPYNENDEDEIVIFYTAIATKADIKDIEFNFLADKYKDQIIDATVIEMAKIGVAKYLDEAHQIKYKNIFQTYRVKYDAFKDAAWATIKLWDIYGNK